MENSHPAIAKLNESQKFRIERINIQSYRGIDDLEFKPRTINIFVGKNNSGKSSVLNAILVNFLDLSIKFGVP
ncbi:MAG: AAA family ATPase [Promethearchaeota archaeon]